MSKTPRWTLIVLAALLVIYTIGWFAVARSIDKRVETGLEDMRLGGFGPVCTNRTMVGFPLAMTLTCATTGAEPLNGRPWQAGRLALSAPFTNPGLFTGTLQSPFVLGEADRQAQATWSELDAKLDMTLGGVIEEIAMVVDDLTIAAGPHSASANAARITLLPDADSPADLPADLTVTATTDAVIATLPYSRTLAATDLTLRLFLKDGAGDLLTRRLPLSDVLADGADIRIDLLRADVEGGAIALSGPLILSPQGTLSGTVSIGLKNRDALARWAATLDPNAAQAVATLAQAVAGMGATRTFDGEEMPAIDLTLDEGDVRLGFIRLGRIPPLKMQ